jgi:hypothetical protein
MATLPKPDKGQLSRLIQRQEQTPLVVQAKRQQLRLNELARDLAEEWTNLTDIDRIFL